MRKTIVIIILFFLNLTLYSADINRNSLLLFYKKNKVAIDMEGDKVLVLDFSGKQSQDKLIDLDLKYLFLLKEVECIHLRKCKNLTDEGLKYLSGLNKLEILNLSDTNITDAGLKYLKNLTSLKELDLFNTKVTDIGIQELSTLKNLNMLLLHGTKVTKKGIDELQKKLPDCYISLETRAELQ